MRVSVLASSSNSMKPLAVTLAKARVVKESLGIHDVYIIPNLVGGPIKPAMQAKAKHKILCLSIRWLDAGRGRSGTRCCRQIGLIGENFAQ